LKKSGQAKEALLHNWIEIQRSRGNHLCSANGIARVTRNTSVVEFEELLKFSNDLYGLAFNLDENEVGVVLLGEHWLLARPATK
jgi:F0F1-type ATP synthase alpha subunit